MTNLDNVLGTLLASVAQARRMADEETARIAEYYRQHEALQGMSAPRIRLPEVVVDLPVLIESIRDTDGTPVSLSEPEIRQTIIEHIDALARTHAVELPRTFSATLGRGLQRQLRSLLDEHPDATWPIPGLLDMVDALLVRTLASHRVARLSGETRATIRRQLAERLNARFLDQADAAGIAVSPITAEIRELANADQVARFKVTLHEEGMEWNLVERADGTTRSTLVPE